MPEISGDEARALNRQAEQELILKNSNSVMACKRLLWEMWYDVDQGQHGSRSPYGDRVLELRDALYDTNEEAKFFDDYSKFLGRKKYVESKQQKDIQP